MVASGLFQRGDSVVFVHAWDGSDKDVPRHMVGQVIDYNDGVAEARVRFPVGERLYPARKLRKASKDDLQVRPSARPRAQPAAPQYTGQHEEEGPRAEASLALRAGV